MSVRTAELLTAIVLAILSIALMFKSTEGLSIGWIKGAGPGSGAWPFWLSAGMLAASIATIVRWFMKITPESRSEAPFMSLPAVKVVGTTVGALVALLLLTHWIGMYLAMMLFLIFYLHFVGGHGWPVTIAFTILVPVGIFCLFEWALQVSLPKGITEEWFYPIYDLIY
jgi:putative tricarboxylic transport membrane protein